MGTRLPIRFRDALHEPGAAGEERVDHERVERSHRALVAALGCFLALLAAAAIVALHRAITS